MSAVLVNHVPVYKQVRKQGSQGDILNKVTGSQKSMFLISAIQQLKLLPRMGI